MQVLPPLREHANGLPLDRSYNMTGNPPGEEDTYLPGRFSTSMAVRLPNLSSARQPHRQDVNFSHQGWFEPSHAHRSHQPASIHHHSHPPGNFMNPVNSLTNGVQYPPINPTRYLCQTQGCSQRATCGMPEERGIRRWCSDHGPARAVIWIDSRKNCEERRCKNQPCYGMEDEGVLRWCHAHRREGAINLRPKKKAQQTCEVADCKKQPSFGLLDDTTKKYRWCKNHCPEGGVNLRRIKRRRLDIDTMLSSEASPPSKPENLSKKRRTRSAPNSPISEQESSSPAPSSTASSSSESTFLPPPKSRHPLPLHSVPEPGGGLTLPSFLPPAKYMPSRAANHPEQREDSQRREEDLLQLLTICRQSLAKEIRRREELEAREKQLNEKIVSLQGMIAGEDLLQQRFQRRENELLQEINRLQSL